MAVVEKVVEVKYLVQADGKLPNLALMRLSSHFKSQGEDVRLVRRGRGLFDPDGECYGSSIFKFSANYRKTLELSWGPIRWGGTGVDVSSSLNSIDVRDWESVTPDYSIYPDFKFSLGFTQRGCRLACKFCVVPEKEGKPVSVHAIPDVWRGGVHPRKLILLDNDFFGQPEWRERIKEIREGGFKVSFCQGINLRQVDEESAAAVASIEYRNNDFNERKLYTAWDNLGDEGVFRRGVATLEKAGVPSKHLMVYMLIGYKPTETWEEIHYRFNALVGMGCEPYPMVYSTTRPDLKAFQRWAVTGLYRAVQWHEYRDPRLQPIGATR